MVRTELCDRWMTRLSGEKVTLQPRVDGKAARRATLESQVAVFTAESGT